MAKAFDVSKFRKSITKSVKGMSVGFHDPKVWISTGNFCLNKLISGDFTKGVPLGKVTMVAGESGAGKSFICSGNLVKNAQKQGIFVILIDSENALDESWLHALDVDTSEDKILKLNMAMIDDVAKTISEFVTEYRTMPEDDRPPVLFVVDSLGMLMSPTEIAQFEKGEMKGDFGRKAKQLKALVTNCVNMFGDLNIGLVATNHTYASQDMFDPDDKISGGSGMIFASSIVVAMKKLKLKEDADGNKITQVQGIRASCQVMKTRYAKPFEKVQIKIPYETGMNPYSGLVDFFEGHGMLAKSGNSLQYTSNETGEVIKMFRKKWEKNENGSLDIMMTDFDSWYAAKNAKAVDDTDANEETDIEHSDDNQEE
jgi:RecA/RadA recombinase